MIKIFFLLLAAFPAQASNKVLWKEWYLLTVAGSPQGYFEETVEQRPKDKHLAITQKWVEKETARTETYIGSVSEDDASLRPVAFFSERRGPRQTYKIDGRARSGKIEVTFKPEKPKGKQTRKSVELSENLYLSNFLPILLARHEPAKGALEFSAVVEDARDGIFDSREGKAEVFGVTRQIRGETCRKATVVFAGIEGEWWISKDGKLCELKIAANGSKLELTTESEARKALGE